MKTCITDLSGIRDPIWQGGMQGVGPAEVQDVASCVELLVADGRAALSRAAGFAG